MQPSNTIEVSNEYLELFTKVRLGMATPEELKTYKNHPTTQYYRETFADPDRFLAFLKENNGITSSLDAKTAITKLKKKIAQLNKMSTFKGFQILERERLPNAIIGITETDSKVFITAPAPKLGKDLGDYIAKFIRDSLMQLIAGPKIECPGCKHHQSHSYPMSGKLYCAGCGVLLEELPHELL